MRLRRSVLWLADLDVHAFLGDLSGDTWDVDLLAIGLVLS